MQTEEAKELAEDAHSADKIAGVEGAGHQVRRQLLARAAGSSPATRSRSASTPAASTSSTWRPGWRSATRAALSRPVNVALPGPCSRKLCTPVWLSSVRNTSTNASCSRARPSASDVDRPSSITRLVSACAASGPPGDLGGELERPFDRVGVDDLVGEADAQRLVGLDLAPGDAQLLGPARADESGEPLRAAAAGDDAEEDLRLAEHGPRPGDAVVAREGELATAAEGVAADRGDHEAGDGGDGVERAVEAGGDRPGLVGALELGDVGTGGEDPLAAGDHDGARRVGGQRLGRLLQLGEQSALDRALTLPLARVTTATPSSRPIEAEQMMAIAGSLASAVSGSRDRLGVPGPIRAQLTDRAQIVGPRTGAEHLVGGGPRVERAGRGRRRSGHPSGRRCTPRGHAARGGGRRCRAAPRRDGSAGASPAHPTRRRGRGGC